LNHRLKCILAFAINLMYPHEQRVVSIAIKNNYTSRFEDDKFAFNYNRPMKWLQRVCFWILRKLHCQSVILDCNRNVRVIEPMRVLDKILEQETELWRRLCYDKPSKILMGPENYCAFTDEVLSDDHFAFNAGYWCRDRYDRTYRGMKIEVIP
jgi:hypothetical protein